MSTVEVPTAVVPEVSGTVDDFYYGETVNEI